MTGPQACVTCAKAKAKCIPLPSGLICERCHRLKKPCSSQTPAPPRVRIRKEKQNPKRKSRVAALESRLEELSSRLAAVDSSQFASGSNSQAFPPSRDQIIDSIEIDSVQGSGIEEHQNLDDAGMPHSFAPSLHSHDRLSHELHESSLPIMPQTPRNLRQSAQDVSTGTPKRDQVFSELLERYHSQMQHRFPFVVVPSRLSSAENRQQRPFLWRAVKMAALWQEHATHSRLGNKLLRDFSEVTLLRSFRSFDVVQGLLVFIAWYHWKLDKFQLTNLLGLLQSLCLSLDFGQDDQSLWKSSAHDMSNSNLEQGRAYCGLYYLSTIVFTMSEKPEVCPQTHFVDPLCQILMTQPHQQPTDKFLVALVKIERLAQSILLMRKEREMSGETTVPLNVIVAGYQQQIRILKGSISEQLIGDAFIQAHLQVLSMMLYEVAIWIPERANISFSNSIGMPQTGIEGRKELLVSCAESVKDLLSNYLRHLSAHLKTAYIASFDIFYCLRLCKRLIAVQGVPRWDEETVIGLLGLDDALLKRRIQDVKSLATSHAGESNTADTAHTNVFEDEEELLFLRTRPGNSEVTSRSPFECMAEDLKSLLSLLTADITTETSTATLETEAATNMRGGPDVNLDPSLMGDLNPPPVQIESQGDPNAFPGVFHQISLWPRLLY